MSEQKLLTNGFRITIMKDSHGYGYEVESDGKTSNGLTWDEMIGQIAFMTVPQGLNPGHKPLYSMRTMAEWEEWKRRISRR